MGNWNSGPRRKTISKQALAQRFTNLTPDAFRVISEAVMAGDREYAWKVLEMVHGKAKQSVDSHVTHAQEADKQLQQFTLDELERLLELAKGKQKTNVTHDAEVPA